MGRTSRDQYSGVFFGLGVTYDMVDEPGVCSQIEGLITRLLDFLLRNNWDVVMPNGVISTTFKGLPKQQLSFLQVGRHVNPARYALQALPGALVGGGLRPDHLRILRQSATVFQVQS